MLSKKWDNRFLEMAEMIANWSKDRSTGVGCVIVDNNRRVLSIGYNGFPQGVNDDVEERHARPAKYDFTEHAERNAIYTAGRNQVNLKGAMLYCTFAPCADCARGIIQTGIKEVVCYSHDHDSKWAESQTIAQEMFQEAGVSFRSIEK